MKLTFSVDDREKWTRSHVDRLRGNVRARIAAAFDAGNVAAALALVALQPRIARAVEAAYDTHAGTLLYSIAHECSARLHDVRRIASWHARCDFPPSPSRTKRAPVARNLQASLPVVDARAASKTGLPEPEQRRAPWEKPP